VRIVGGLWRSRVIPFSGSAGLRPTPDRVRETLFNWLGQDLAGKTCLDLYAGSGALGFEAASRGARCVVMVEHDARTVHALEDNRALLGAAQVEVVRGDALEFLRTDRRLYDAVFLDPPFATDPWPDLFGVLAERLAPQALVYCELGRRFVPPEGWAVWRQGQAGQVRYQLLKRT